MNWIKKRGKVTQKEWDDDERVRRKRGRAGEDEAKVTEEMGGRRPVPKLN